MTARTPTSKPLPPDSDTLTQRFSARASKLGVTVERIAALDAVTNRVAELAADVAPDVRRVVLAPGLDRKYPALRQQLEARGITLTPIDVHNPAATFGPLAIGISEASLGVAETGSIVVGDTLEDRLVRMLAFRHIVVLDLIRLVPSLDEAGEWLRDRFMGTGHYASFITGPSRTADIEMSLSVGAHGPAELQIAILDREAAHAND